MLSFNKKTRNCAMFSSENTLYIMPTRYAGGKAITPFSNLTFDKLSTHDILKTKRSLNEKEITIENAIIGGGDIWLLSPKERAEYINFICGEFETVSIEVIPSSVFETNHSNCSVKYIMDFTPHTSKAKEAFVLKQVGNAHIIAYISSIAIKYGFNNCMRIVASMEGINDIYFAEWVYKTPEAKASIAKNVEKFKKDLKHPYIRTSVKIKNNEPSISSSPARQFCLFPTGFIGEIKNNLISKV